MKKRGWLFCIVIGITLLLSACDHDTRYQDLDGHSFTLSQYKGKWLLINYWAPWCKSCHKELPALNAFYRKHKKDGIMLMGVNYDLPSPETLRQLVKKYHIDFPVLTTDPAKELGIDNVPGLPSTYIIGPDGKVVKRLFGVQTEQSLESALQTKLSYNGTFNAKYLHT